MVLNVDTKQCDWHHTNTKYLFTRLFFLGYTIQLWKKNNEEEKEGDNHTTSISKKKHTYIVYE